VQNFLWCSIAHIFRQIYSGLSSYWLCRPVTDPRNQGKAALLETEFLALFRFSIMLGNLEEKKQLAKRIEQAPICREH
jgi:hypothetical protein